MKRHITLLPFSANQQDILLLEGAFIKHKLKAEDDVEQEVLNIVKKSTGIKTKLKHWDLFCKLLYSSEEIGYYYRLKDNCIYDYKKGFEIISVEDALQIKHLSLMLNLALSKDFDIADLHKF